MQDIKKKKARRIHKIKDPLILGDSMIGTIIDFKDEEAYKVLKDNVKSEKNLLGDDIRNIMISKFSDPYITTIERSVGGNQISPFDLIIGHTRDIELAGLEIKGDTDTFDRLKTQLDAYTFAFSEVYLVLHKKESPKWLPRFCGVIRVFENKKSFIEKQAYIDDVLDISTTYEWDTIMYMNGIKGPADNIRKIYRSIGDIRKNILFNRFFATYSGFGEKKYSKYYPMQEYQKQVLMGFNIPFQTKILKRDIKDIEKRLNLLKEALDLVNPQTKIPK